MKKLIVLVIIFFLVSCKPIQMDDVEYEITITSLVYGYNITSNSLETIELPYEVLDPMDVFELYTKYQNRLPQEYVSYGSSNVELLDMKVEDDIVYYTVDSFIYLCDNLDLFLELLDAANKKLGYKDSVVIYMNKIIQ